MMLIHIQVARGDYLEVEAGMVSEEFEHVVEEPYARGYLHLSISVQFQLETDLRFCCFSLYCCFSHVH